MLGQVRSIRSSAKTDRRASAPESGRECLRRAERQRHQRHDGIQLVSAGSLGVLQTGDLLMVIQMQGATIDTIDSDAYGTIIDLFGAGLYAR